MGLPFCVTLPQAEEQHPEVKSIEQGTIANARVKATSILEQLPRPTDIALGADTLVVLGTAVLGKPKDEADAIRILGLLSGKIQTVYTGIHLVSPHYGKREAVVTSEVHFKKMTAEEIRAYAKTREPYDKAGAYAVQGLGALFIEKIVGSYTNVMGLPIEAVMNELTALTKIPIYEWFK